MRAGVGLLAFAGLSVLPMVGAIGVQHAGNRQIEIRMKDAEARETGCRNGSAVIAALAGDELLALGLAAHVVVIPGELDLRVVGFRAGVGEEHLGGRHRGQGLDLLGQRDCRLVTAPAEQVGEGKPRHLLAGGFDQLLVAVAEACAPEPGKAFDVALAAAVVDVDAFRALQHQRSGAAMGEKIGRRVQQGFDIAGSKVGDGAHGSPQVRRNWRQSYATGAGCHLASGDRAVRPSWQGPANTAMSGQRGRTVGA